MTATEDLKNAGAFTGNSGKRWAVGPEIGRGGTAVVFEVSCGDCVGAAKLLSEHRFAVTDDLVERFRREIEHLRSLDHPNVASVLDDAIIDGAPVLVLERATDSLNDLVRGAAAPAAMPDGLAWLIQSAAGLDAVGQRGLVHRDVSLKNLLLRPDGSLMVADFGTILDPEDITITKGEGLGSLLFISPDQFADPHNATAADDVYSLGQVAYYVLTGRAPHGNPPPVCSVRWEIPQPFGRLVDTMRAHDRNRRPTIGSVLVDLMRLVPFVSVPNGVPILGNDSAISRQLARVVQERQASLSGFSIEGRGSGGVDPTWASVNESVEEARLALAICRGDVERGLVDVYCERCGSSHLYLARESLPHCRACGQNQLDAIGIRAGSGFVRAPERG